MIPINETFFLCVSQTFILHYVINKKNVELVSKYNLKKVDDFFVISLLHYKIKHVDGFTGIIMWLLMNKYMIYVNYWLDGNG